MAAGVQDIKRHAGLEERVGPMSQVSVIKALIYLYAYI